MLDSVPDLHASRPVAHVLSQQQVVHGDRADEVENLPEDLRDDLGVESVLGEGGVDEGEDPEELVQRLLRVHVRRRVQVAVAARGQPRSAVEWGYLVADVFNFSFEIHDLTASDFFQI